MRCLGDSDLSVVSFDAFDMCHVSFEDSDTWPLILKLRLHKSPLTAALWKVREDANALRSACHLPRSTRPSVCGRLTF